MTQTIKRALISVTNKDGICGFASELVHTFGVEIISTGGTAQVLRQANIPFVPIEEFTGIREMMGGRVKTLHPRVHGGILCRRDNPSDMEDARTNHIDMIDLVCINLYEFEKTIARKECSEDEAIESIDIGGPSMLRSAAKNFRYVTVVSDTCDYARVLDEMKQNNGATTLEFRRMLAHKVFSTTARYDAAIEQYFSQLECEDAHVLTPEIPHAQEISSPYTNDSLFPREFTPKFKKLYDVRYGENPHQKAAFYVSSHASVHSVARAQQLGGKPLSYNNLLDTDAAWNAVCEFEEPAVVILKHQNPCGSAVADSIEEAYRRAYACDPKSAYGGIIAANREVTLEFVREFADVNKQFVEVIIAPSYTQDARERLSKRKNLRVLQTGGIACDETWELRSIDGGLLVQTRDCATEDPTKFKVVSSRTPSDKEMDDLLFAWKVCKTVKSNAILIAKDKAGIGLGCGQPNRVDSAIMACERALEAATRFGMEQGNFACASDAFFPFRDDVDELAQRGVSCIIQPGGSMRDEECIRAANEHGIAMVFTGYRHFRH